MRALPAVAWAADAGVMVDKAAWLALAADLDAAPNAASLFGGRNWTSQEQVKAAFSSVGVGVESTDDDRLAAIDHPLADLIRRHRAAAKRAGTYGRKWLDHVGDDGRVRPGWRQCSTASGRMSCA